MEKVDCVVCGKQVKERASRRAVLVCIAETQNNGQLRLVFLCQACCKTVDVNVLRMALKAPDNECNEGDEASQEQIAAAMSEKKGETVH